MAEAFDVQQWQRAYVIGDIHGRLDCLDRMVEAISEDIGAHSACRCLTVTLGDYIDRGLNSRGVLERLTRNPFPIPYIALKGNHEVMLETFLQDPAFASQWRQFGGLETLHSYGIPVKPLMVGKNYHEAAEALDRSIPPSHREFLVSLEVSLDLGRYFLCHAGIRPGIAFEQQTEVDLLWIRNEFLKYSKDFGKIVVHGHTPVDEPEILSNRINIDTGAFATGRLTCAVLEGPRPRFIFVSPSETLHSLAGA